MPMIPHKPVPSRPSAPKPPVSTEPPLAGTPFDLAGEPACIAEIYDVLASVRPLCVFAAGRTAFLAQVNTTDPELAKGALFAELPLEECGWDPATAVIARASDPWCLLPAWKLWRG